MTLLHDIKNLAPRPNRRVSGTAANGEMRPRATGRVAWLLWSIQLVLLALPSAGQGAESSVRLGWRNRPGGVEVSWISPSLTPSTPFVHYEFQVQYSANLSAWENAVLIPGGFLGSASVNRTFQLPTTNSQGFVRLSYRLNMPGANLSGLDLSGADLRGANLAGANLSGTKLDGALLGGAALDGAILLGATFTGANLQDVDLTGFDLGSIDLSTILGMPSLTQVTANPLGSAAELVPNFPYNSDGSDLVTNDPNVPGAVSTRHAMLMLRTNATVGQLNALLAAHGAAIVASSPGDATLPNAVLMARFPTAGAQALYDLTVALNNDPIVEAAAPDVWLGLNTIPEDAGAAPGWRWDLPGGAQDGNWGLEIARVPQMWNVHEALRNKGAARVPTCIIDVYFDANHEDLQFSALLGSTPLEIDDHGNHVAGIAGATYGNGKGIDGVNPLADLIGYTFRSTLYDLPVPVNPGAFIDPGRQANAFSMINDIRSALRQAPQTRIINMSLGYNWYHKTNASRPRITDPFTPTQQAAIQFIAQKYGVLMRGAALSAGSVLIVCAAGNDHGLIPASLASPMCTAALQWGAPNILVVGSHDMNRLLSVFSNSGGHVAAPGESILSAQGSNTTTYATYRGTSMAAPFVSGVAGFLLAAAPTLTPTEVITLIRKAQPNVDAFTSLMEIDRLPGRFIAHDREVLKMLIDIDDGSLDGSRRVDVEEAYLGQDRAFELVTGPDVDSNNFVPGDGVIDMADFRRWRDWLLFTEGGHALNGSATHLKFDGNGDGTAHPFEDALLYPRGDFNGDGLLDRDTPNPVPGYLRDSPAKDLEVLILSDLWEDACYTNVFNLPDLIDSVDFHVSATNFFYKHTDLDEEVKVAAYDAETRQALPGGGVCLSPQAPLHVLTVPVGGTYYVASEPISKGGGTNVMMRSLGNKQITTNLRGADFVVDLALVEMTAVADTLNPALRSIQSRPDTNQIDAYLGTSIDSTNPPTIGARAWANENGTLYAIGHNGSLSLPPTNRNEFSTFAGAVRWERSFIKSNSVPYPRLLLKPMRLEIGGGGFGTREFSAFAEVSVEMRAYDVSPAWQPVFFYRAEIAGNSDSGFRIVGQEGDLPPKPLQMDGLYSVKYEQERYKGRINLDGVANGHSFEVRCRLNVRAVGPEDDATAIAWLGDPLEHGSGLRMNYGSFGDLPWIKRVSRSAGGGAGFQAAGQPPVLVEYLSKTNFYYRLYRGGDADTTGLPFAMKLGINGDDSMTDPAPLLPNPTEEDYTLENQPLDRPLDFDGDDMDDVFELRHAAVLNPLDAADALLDPDGDGRSNLTEYRDGTDPATPDNPPSSPALNFPGLIIPTYTGGQLIDLNNDGLLDSAVGLSVALRHLGGTFAAALNSPRPDMRILSGFAFVKLDGDAYSDAVLTDSLTNRVFLFRGVGDGTFEPLTNYPAINGPSQVVLGRLNSDAIPDIALMSANGRGADLHANNGDGTLTPIATLTTNAFGTANALALGDFNGDQRDDVVVTYSANAVVFLSQPGGGYGNGQPYAVGSSPAYIAVGDLNGDGLLDLVTANRSSVDLSVLLGGPGGTFLPQVRYSLGGPLTVGPQSLRLVDLNGDQRLDAVVARSSRDFATVFISQSGGTFAGPYLVPGGDTLTDIIDWNGDGKLDLIGYAYGVGGLVTLGNGDGTFDTRLQIFPTNTPPTQVSAVDLNADGKLELVGLQTQLNSVDVWEHAAVTGTSRLLSSFPVGQWVTAYAPGDFNGDGLMDLAVTTQTNSFNPRGSNQVVILTNSGNFTFADASHFPLDLRPTLLVPGDFNGDGALDLAAHIGGGSLSGGSKIVALLNDGAGGFQTGAPALVGVTVSSLTLANADADARSELLVRGSRLVGATTVNFLEVFAVDAVAGWTNRQTLGFTNTLNSLQVLPVNGDAYPDLAVTQTDQLNGRASLRMYPGGPSGFGSEEILADATGFSSFTRLADLNGDGLLDVVGGNTLHLAKPGGGYHPAQTIWIGAAGAQGVADFNRDGKPDLFNGLSVLLQK